MEFLVSGLMILLISLFVAYLLFINNKPKNLPLRKTGLPYIGESLEFVKSGLECHPEKFIFDRIAKYSSQVFKTSVLIQPTIVVCGPAANKFLFPNENKLVNQMEIAESKKAGQLLNWDDIQKMKYSWNVACEAMRPAPPSRGTFREAITDFSFSGFSVPKGWKLLWSSHSTNWSLRNLSRQDSKGPAPYMYVPFGGGPRMCLGKEYAPLEILVFMHNVIKKFRWEKLLVDEKIIVNPMSAPEKGFPARLIPHKA